MSGDATQWLWLIALVGGPLILGIVMARGMRQSSDRREHDPAGIARTERATHDLYEEEEHRGEPSDAEIADARRLEEKARPQRAGQR